MAPIASYLPESQIITLSKDFPALSDPDELVGFTNPEQFAFFFHEWIHFLHNISTISGFSLFCTQVILWSNFRWSMDNRDVSKGSTEMDLAHIENNKNFFSYILSNREWHKFGLANHIKTDDLSFEEAHLQGMKIVNHSVICTSLIKCTINHAENQYNLDIGVLEILESAAYMLESKCLKAMNGTPQPAAFYPYHLIKGLAGKMAPSLNEDEIICCMLASLQSNDPPNALFKLLQESEYQDVNSRYERLVSHVKKQLTEQDKIIRDSLNQIQSLFPVDEPMGNFIKLTLDRIVRNLNHRKEDPFFELNIIKDIAKNTASMNEIIRNYGGCTIIQKRHDDNEKPQCDIMYDFLLPENTESVLFGSKMLRACFHFIFLHYRPSGEIVKTEKIDLSQRNKCPFYTVCCSSLRVNHSSICAESPWQSMNIIDNKDCYYAAAVKATNPPS